MMNFFSSAYVQVIGLGTCNVGGYTKKATSSAGIFVFYCLGSIIGPQIFNRYVAEFTGLTWSIIDMFVQQGRAKVRSWIQRDHDLFGELLRFGRAP